MKRFSPSGSHENGSFAASVILMQFEGPVFLGVVTFFGR